MGVVIPTEAVRDRLNADPVFEHAARHWHTQLLLRVGDEGYVLQIADGKVRRFESGADLFDGFAAVLGGTEDDWARLLSPVPPPFYQDFFGAFFQHDFQMAGDLDAVFSYYWALLRLLEVTRAVYNGADAGTEG